MTYERTPPADARLPWVLVANGARARLFVRDPDNGALRELASFVHPASRTAPGELGHDRPGQARKGAAHTAFVPHTDPHERELAVFARELSAALEAAVLEHRLGRWSLIASSPFLGRLRAELGERSAACLDCHVDRDLTTFEGAELESRVSALLPPPPPAP